METILTKGQVPLPIDHEIRVRLESGRADSFLLIVPTAQARLKLQRECLECAPNRAVAGLHIHTLEDFVQRFYGGIGGGQRQLSLGLQMIWLRQILDGGKFTFFSPPLLSSPPLPSSPTVGGHEVKIPVPQGTVTRLTNTINQLKMSGIYPSHLRRDLAESEGAERDKLADLIAIYEAYEQKLGHQWIDRAGVHGAVSNDISKSPLQAKALMAAIFPHVNLVVVKGFDVFSPPDFSILTGIANLPQIGLCIVLDFDAQNESLFGYMKESYDQLLSLGFEPVHSVGLDQPNPPAPPRNGEGREWEGGKNSPLLLGEGTGERSSQAVIRERHFAQNLFRKDRWFQPPVEKLDLTEQITLLQAPDRVQEVERMARLIKQLALEQPAIDLHRMCLTFYNLDVYASLIREVFPLYGIPYALAQGVPLANSSLVLSIFSLLESAINHSQSLKVRQSPYFSIDNPQLSLLTAQLSVELSPETFETAFDRLMEAVQVRQRILRVASGQTERESLPSSIIVQDISAYRCFRALLDELVDFLMLEYGGEHRHSLGAYVNWLRLMVSQETLHVSSEARARFGATSPPSNGGICILPLVQTKELDFDILILGGLVDGEFPDAFRPDAFQPPRRSRTESDRLRENRFLFYQALKCYRKHLYLTVPQCDGDVELVQSSFIDELRRVAEIDEGSGDSSAVLFSEESFLKHYGKCAWEQVEEKQEDWKIGRLEETLLLATPSSILPASLLPSLRLIAHNVRVEKSRTVTHDLLEYEGYLRRELLSPSSQRALENERERVYSISELERYGQCPFRYFAHKLNPTPIEEDDDEGEDLTHRQKGELLHTILFEFYHNRHDQPPLSASTDSEFEGAVQELRTLAQEHLGRSKQDGLFWEIDVVETLIGGHGRAGTLPTFLAEERKRKFDVHPRYFEVQFGHRNMSERVDSILSCAEPIQVGGVPLSGRVDRVELGDGFFTVADYKTGSYTPKIRDILEGRSLQLPLYLFAIEQLLRKHPPGAFRGVGGVYYTLREDCKAELGIGEREYNGKAFRAGPTSGQLLPNSAQGVQSLQAIIDLAIEHTNRYVRSIVNGEFPLTSHDKKLVCRSCPFKKSCRVGAIVEEESET